ncbi:hypothetical protein ACFSCW_09930 [Sphingomonas tabacisoli]|uniref:Uncharacterized protein n=1 Tax=Sphingomonas tabacisoli TaxID=2249466 RepID=A0ABW4I2X8_9SPHN
MRLLFAAILVAGISSPAWATDCPNPQGWAKPERHLAARSPDMKFGLKPGGTAQIGLLDQNQVKFAVGKATRKGYAGLAALDVAKAGTLEIVLDNKTFVDLVRDGKALDLASEPKGHGCPGVQKALDFKVTPGRYVVQLSGSPDKSVKMGTVLR